MKMLNKLKLCKRIVAWVYFEQQIGYKYCYQATLNISTNFANNLEQQSGHN